MRIFHASLATLLLIPTGVQTLATQFWAYEQNLAYGQAAPFALVMIAVAAVPSYVLGRFFDRTFVTGSLLDLAAQVLRRLSGIQVETSAVFNMSTQFGGGKSHSLTALYHLARHGDRAKGWNGVDRILKKADISTVPEAAAVAYSPRPSRNASARKPRNSSTSTRRIRAGMFIGDIRPRARTMCPSERC